MKRKEEDLWREFLINLRKKLKLTPNKKKKFFFKNMVNQ